MAKIKTHWVKTTSYGDYKETKDRINSRTCSQTMIIREAKKLGVAGRHAGSKPIKNLLRGIAKAHTVMRNVPIEYPKVVEENEYNAK